MKRLAIPAFFFACCVAPVALGSGLGTTRPLEAVRGPLLEEMRWHGWLPNGQVVEINNIFGNVRAEASDSDEIEVIARKQGDGAPERVSIEVVPYKGGITVCAVYPSQDPDKPFECRPSHGGGFRTASATDSVAHVRWDNGGGGDVLLNGLRVDFVVRLPKRLRFIGRTVDGEVSTYRIEQDVEAHSARGDIHIDLGGASGADVRAETGDGRVRSEFPLSTRCFSSGMLASGHIGRAHHAVHAKTGSGNIDLGRPI